MYVFPQMLSVTASDTMSWSDVTVQDFVKLHAPSRERACNLFALHGEDAAFKPHSCICMGSGVLHETKSQPWLDFCSDAVGVPCISNDAL